MSGEKEDLALKSAILEWRKKYGIQDSDPMLAAVELWGLYYSHAQVNGAKQIPSFEEFRGGLEQLGHLSNDVAGRAAEIIQELRAVPKIRSDLNSFPKFALVFTAAVALLAGLLIGKCLLSST